MTAMSPPIAEVSVFCAPARAVIADWSPGFWDAALSSDAAWFLASMTDWSVSLSWAM